MIMNRYADHQPMVHCDDLREILQETMVLFPSNMEFQL